MQMIALKAFPYAGRRLAVGQTFEARGAQDARLLKAIGKAKPYVEVVAPVVEAKPTYQRKVIEAEVPVIVPEVVADPAPDGDADVIAVPVGMIDITRLVDAEPVSVPAKPYGEFPSAADGGFVDKLKPKRTYKRRDMQSE